MNASVDLLLLEIRMGRETVLAAVLEYEICSRMEDILLEYLVGDVFQPLKGIRRVREYYIELFAADRQEIEHVVPYYRDVAQAESRGLGLDEGGVLAGHLYAVHAPDPAGGELIGYGSGAAEKVQDLQVVELVFVVEDVEEGLPGEIRGRPCIVMHGRADGLALEASPYDSHICSTALKYL